jgi:pyruvate dehydrogenase E2 component (dihydrolipoamide acetyltransferase)
MDDASELLMPKLGLTMTEGRVARWVIAPGAQFAAGDIVVEIETDKIVNEVEAPAGGMLVEQVVPEGQTVPVGTALARWRLDGETTARICEKPPQMKAATVAHAARRDAPGPRQRSLATPYARKLAALADLDIATLQGSGPGGRIKAFDVEQAIHRSEAPQLPMRAQAEAVPVWAPPPRNSRAARALSFVTCDVDASRLEDIETRVGQSGSAVRPDRRHYVALACLRAITADGKMDVLRIGFDSEAGAGRYVTVDIKAGASLSTLAALHADAMSAAANHRANDETSAGQILILIGSNVSHVFAPSVPAGWAMVVGIGAVRDAFRADATGAPRRVREMTLALSYDEGVVPHARALDFIGVLAAHLEEPLGMLVA